MSRAHCLTNCAMPAWSSSASFFKLIRILALLPDFRHFLESTLFGDMLENFTALNSEDALRAWAASRADDLFASGLWQPNLAVNAVNPAKISEDTRHAWLLDSNKPPTEGETIIPADKPEAYTGCKAPRYDGQVVEAARGSLGHWLSIENGRINRYQIIAPTTRNFSPRDSEGQPGLLEQALIGLPAGDMHYQPSSM